MDGSRSRIGLLLLGGLALGLRIWLVGLLLPNAPTPNSYEHGRIAENLLAGRGFSIEFLGTEGPTSQQAPFYPFLLAGAYWLFGVASPYAILAVHLLQCVVGAALVLTVTWLTWSLLPHRPSIGWVAGAGAAVYPSHLYAVTHLQVALWAAFVLSLLLAVVLSPTLRATNRGAVFAGCLAGALLLIEPILALALPICAIALWAGDGTGPWRSRFAQGPVGRLALMAGITALFIAPWTVRNLLVHKRPLFIKSTFGYAFWQANNPLSWGTDKIPKASAELLRVEHDGTLAGIDHALWEARHETLYIDDVLLKPDGYREFAGLSEPQRSELLGRRAWQFVCQNPGRYARLCLQRLRYFLLFDETNPKAANRLYRISTMVWLVLMLMGLWLSAEQWRSLWPTYAVFVAVTLFHSLVIVSARFRIPIEPMTFVWASSALTPLLVRLMPARRLRIYRPGEQPRDPFGQAHVLRGPHYDLHTRRRAG